MTASKIVAAAASGVGGAGLDVDEVFSTDLYDGNNSGQTITNGIDLSGEGGLVWIKGRDYTINHVLTDTVRGNTKYLEADGTSGEDTTSVGITAFNSNGFTLGADNTWKFNVSNSYVSEYVSWTFRKAPKFFDVVTYTGNATVRTIAHNLGSTPGMIIIKKTSGTGPWYVFHRSSTDTDGKIGLQLNESDAQGDFGNTHWDVSEMSSTHFGLGNMGNMNGSGNTYVAYLFAHNNGDGEFGPNSDQDIIHCGQYTTNGSGLATVNVGFEPQWLLVKRTNATQDWAIFDVARGIYMNNDYFLKPNRTNAESGAGNQHNITATGFTCHEHSANANYIFVAIRRGPLAEPENGTDVFSQTAVSGNNTDNRVITSGFQTDIVLHKKRSSGANWFLADRKRGERSALKVFSTDLANGEADYGNYIQEIDLQDGVEFGNNGDVNGGSPATYINYQWKRSPSFCDVVCYNGTGSTQNINHSLGVAPEMMWIKRRDSSGSWMVYHKGLNGGTNPEQYVIYLEATQAADQSSGVWNNTAPTSSVFTVNTNNGVNNSSGEYIAYLFGSVSGVSKIGSVNITSTSNFNVDCGFSNGARFVMVKAFNQSAPWYVSDTARGINSGSADPLVFFNDSSVENTASDWIEPYSAGFTIKGNFYNGYNLIYWAIA